MDVNHWNKIQKITSILASVEAGGQVASDESRRVIRGHPEGRNHTAVSRTPTTHMGGYCCERRDAPCVKTWRLGGIIG